MIEDRKRIASEESLHLIIEKSPDALLTISPAGILLYANPAAETLFERPVAEMLGTEIGFLVGGEESTEIEVLTPKGLLKVSEMRLVEIEWEGEKATLLSMRDITERKKLQERLSQAQKIESIGQLAGGVAHDFNNMLGVILGHTEMELMKAGPSSPFISDLQEICKAANRSAELTRQLMTFARKQVIVPKVLDLNESVTGTLKMLQRLIGENIQLSWDPAANLWPVIVDPSQINQILTNLCV
ncbi:MAG: two-component system sensor histidine kinase NtrB, partial [Desulfuromonadales bacterium]